MNEKIKHIGRFKPPKEEIIYIEEHQINATSWTTIAFPLMQVRIRFWLKI